MNILRKEGKKRKTKKEKAMEKTKCQVRNLVQKRSCLPDGETGRLSAGQPR